MHSVSSLNTKCVTIPSEAFDLESSLIRCVLSGEQEGCKLWWNRNWGDYPRTVARVLQQEGPKTKRGGAFLKYNIGWVQQPGGQTWNGVPGTTAPSPLVTALDHPPYTRRETVGHSPTTGTFPPTFPEKMYAKFLEKSCFERAEPYAGRYLGRFFPGRSTTGKFSLSNEVSRNLVSLPEMSACVWSTS